MAYHHKIVEKQLLAPEVKLIKVTAPRIARKAQPGQFVVLRVDDKGERIPLTIADFDRASGTITLIFQEVGKTTIRLGELAQGDHILDILGPLGNHIELEQVGRVICIAGGVGVAPLYPKVKALKGAGNTIISIVGARTKELLILIQELDEFSDKLYIATDDGSHGYHGFVSELLRNLLDKGLEAELAIAIGPLPMMKATCQVTASYGLKTLVSLNPIMVDGTGMCGGCRVTVANKTRFCCVHGPTFDGHLVDFDELIRRQSRFLSEERHALELYRKK